MKKILSLLLLIATILGVQNTGTAQTSNCEVKVRCSKLDSAAALIEKGKICEQQIKLFEQIQLTYKRITNIYEEENASLQDSLRRQQIKLWEAESLISYQKIKIKRKNKKLIGSIGLNALLLLLLL